MAIGMVATSVSKHVVAEDERTSAAEIAKLLGRIGRGTARLVFEPETGVAQIIEITGNLAEAILQLSRLIQTGKEVKMIADDPELSPEQASDLLGMSRPMLVQRIKFGDIAARKVGAHHRIKTSDLFAFQAREAERDAALAEFGETTDELTAKHGVGCTCNNGSRCAGHLRREDPVSISHQPDSDVCGGSAPDQRQVDERNSTGMA
jgi:excisionase family DNA binding protein